MPRDAPEALRVIDQRGEQGVLGDIRSEDADFGDGGEARHGRDGS